MNLIKMESQESTSINSQQGKVRYDAGYFNDYNENLYQFPIGKGKLILVKKKMQKL